MGHQHAAGGQGTDVHAGDAQQDGQHPAADIPHVGGTLTHQLIVHPGEHLGVHGTDLIHRRLGALTGVDDLAHLALHEGIAEHHDLAGEDLRLLFAHLGADALGHGGGLLIELGDGTLQAVLFHLFATVFHGGVVQALFPDTDGLADADAVGSGDAT